MDYKTLGKNVKKYRLLREMRQEDLAAICDCSVSHSKHADCIERWVVLYCTLL